MSWSTPRTWAVGETVTAANMNQYISDNLSYLYSHVSAEFEMFGASLWPSATSPAQGSARVEMSTNKNYINSMNFVNGSQTYAEGCLPALPDDYNGSTITAKFIWAANSSSTNSVIWGIAAVAWADNDALDTAFGTAQEVTDGNNGTYKVNVSAATSAITIGNTPTAGKPCQFRVYRKGSGSDNLAVAAMLLGVVINYTRS